MNERKIERKFYHDLLNLASSMRGMADVINDVDNTTRSEMLLLIRNIAETMVETINLQRLYRSMEEDDLKLIFSTVDCDKLLTRTANIYCKHTLCQNKTIKIKQPGSIPRQAPLCLFTDKDVLQGALGYGIRFATESIQNGQTIHLDITTEENQPPHTVVFSISFTGMLSEEDKVSIFKKPEADILTMKGLYSYVFYTLVTRHLHGRADWATDNGSVILNVRFLQKLEN